MKTILEVLWDVLRAVTLTLLILLVISKCAEGASWVKTDDKVYEYVETVPYGEGLQAQITLAVVFPVGVIFGGDETDCGIKQRIVWGWKLLSKAHPGSGRAMKLCYAMWDVEEALIGRRFI